MAIIYLCISNRLAIYNYNSILFTPSIYFARFKNFCHIQFLNETKLSFDNISSFFRSKYSLNSGAQESVKWYFRSSSISILVESFTRKPTSPLSPSSAWPDASLIHAARGTRTRGKKTKKKKRKGKERKEWKERSTVHVDDTGVQQRERPEKKRRRKKKTVPRVAIGGRHFCLLAVFPARFHGYCSHRSPVIIVLTLVWLFPSCHAITCRELACCTSRIPRTCPRPTQRRASVLIWPQKNQWIRPFFFSFLFFFSPSLGTSINSRFISFLPFLRLSLFLSLSRSFFFSPSIYLSIYLSGFVGTRLFASLFPRFLRMAGFGERTTLPPLNTANAFMNMHRDDPVQPGWMLGGKWHVGQKSLHLVVFDTPVHQPGPGGTGDGTRVLEIEFDLRFGNFFGSGFCYKFPHWKVRLGRRFWIRFWRISDKRSVLRNYVIALHDLARDFLGKWLKRGKKKGRNNWKQEKEINFT